VRDDIQALQTQLADMIFGQDDVIRHLLIALFASGHVLLEGVPGVGKTRLARSLTQLLGGVYKRIQFTPDLMPSDVTGSAIFNMADNRFEVQQGPIFANVVLADEINRTPPKTQAALLEAMEERQVTIYGEEFSLPMPFLVIATQNPIEYEGTYALPEAQVDRFLMQIEIGYPDAEAELRMLSQHKAGMAHEVGRLAALLTPQQLAAMQREVGHVIASPVVLDYIVRLVRASRNRSEIVLGASPRAATALLDAAKSAAYIEGRDYIIPDDVLEVAVPVLRHRLVLSPNAQLEGVSTDEVVLRVVRTVEVPH